MAAFYSFFKCFDDFDEKSMPQILNEQGLRSCDMFDVVEKLLSTYETKISLNVKNSRDVNIETK